MSAVGAGPPPAAAPAPTKVPGRGTGGGGASRERPREERPRVAEELREDLAVAEGVAGRGSACKARRLFCGVGGSGLARASVELHGVALEPGSDAVTEPPRDSPALLWLRVHRVLILFIFSFPPLVSIKEYY